MCNKETGDHWNESEIDCHINIKEILAVKFSLKSFVSHFKSISVKIYIDNTTIVAAIRHMGTSHSDIINKYTKDVWNGAMRETSGLYLLMSAVGIILLTCLPEKHTWMGNGCLILTFSIRQC